MLGARKIVTPSPLGFVSLTSTYAGLCVIGEDQLPPSPLIDIAHLHAQHRDGHLVRSLHVQIKGDEIKGDVAN